MDDDLPKEGELLDISKKRVHSVDTSGPQNLQTTSSTKLPVGLLIVLVLLALVAFFAKGGLGTSHVDKDKAILYKQATQSVIGTMKSQFPYLENVGCEGSDPDKDDCVHFVGRFRPIVDSPTYLSSMGTIDKAPGVSDQDIELIKGHIKVLADSKRTIISSRELLTFLIDSVTIPKVGEPYSVKIKCTESGVDAVICETIR